jgi:hypothetical protein
MAGGPPVDTDWLENGLKYVKEYLPLPEWATEALGILVLAGMFLRALSPITSVAWRFWKAVIRPHLASPEERHRGEVRRKRSVRSACR